MEIFQYSFMIRALIAGIAVGITAPLIGNFLVAKKYSLIADTLAHISLAGVAFGLIFNLSPILSALIFSVLAGAIIEWLRKRGRLSGDSVLAMLLSGGLALAVVLIGFSQKANTDLTSFLFGSISTVTPLDLYLIIPLAFLVVFFVYFFFKELIFIAFNEESARVSGVPVDFLNLTLVVLTAVTTSIAIRTIGSLLVGALIVIPVISAYGVANSFKESVVISIFFSLFAIISGLIASFYLNLPAGGAIVLISIFIYLTCNLFTKK